LKDRITAAARGLAGLAVLVWMAVLFLLRMRRTSAETRPRQEAAPQQAEADEAPPEENPARRRFLSLITLSAGGALSAGIAVPPVAFVLAPMFRREDPVWREVGEVDDFEVGETVRVVFDDPSPLPWAGVTARSAAWLRRLDQDDFEAFSIYCTHLGCAVRWVDSAALFMCPCHGGVFHADGSIAAGPLRGPLARHGVRVRAGVVEVQTLGLPLTGPVTAE
jgi:menaquinol-cytochrome c reductase iron-sulfur subunit